MEGRKLLCTNKQKKKIKSYNFTPLQCLGNIAANQHGLYPEEAIITMVCFLDFQRGLL